MSEKDEQYNITIPLNILCSKKITPNDKLLYGEIAHICNQDGYCIKRNDYFAKLLGIKTNTSVSLWVKSLKDEGLIRCKFIKPYIRVIFLIDMDKKFINEVINNLKQTFKNLKDNTTYYKHEHFDDAHATDNFVIETKEWTDKEGVKRGRDLIDYG